MADNYYKIKETTLTEVANAIRTKTSTTEKVAVNEFADKILGITNTLAGGGGTVEDVNVLPEASVENVGKMYYLTTDQNVYECVEEKNYTFNVGDTITQQLYFDTNIIPEEVFTTNEPVIIMSHDDIALGYVPDLLDDGSTKVLVEEERSGLTIYYIDSTKSLDEINQLFSRAGLVIPHYGWLEDKVRMSDSTSFEITEVDNSSKIVFTKSYQNVQLSAGCADAIDGITEINGVVTFNRQDAELNVRGDTVTIHVKSSDSTVDLSQATGQLDIERIEGSGCTVTANNLSAENIKKDVNILGITGTFEGGTKLNIKYTGNKNEILGNTDHTQLCVYIGDTNVNKVIAEDVEKPQDSVEIVTRDNKFVNLAYTMGAKVNNIWYVFGGETTNYSTNYKTYKYDLVTNTYTTTTNIPYRVELGVAVAYNTNIYIFGGLGSSVLNTIYKFDTTNETFTKLSATLPTAFRTRSCGGCLATNGNIYIFGGYNGSSGLNQILKFDPTTETITKLSTTLPMAMNGASCVAYGNYVYIFSGTRIYKFDITNETITELSTKLEYNAFYLAEIIGDNIYITGSTTTYYKINIFNVKTETIVSNSLELPIAASDDSIITKYLNSIYITNGSDIANSIININTIFDPIPLTQNNLLLGIGEKTDYKFKLLNGDTADIDYYIKNVYIGNADNNAELIDAYVYKEDGWYNVNTGEMLLTSEYTPAPSGVYKNIDQLLEYQDNYYVLKDKIDQIDFTSYDSLVASNLIQEEEI